jgi:hypothetical protein
VTWAPFPHKNITTKLTPKKQKKEWRRRKEMVLFDAY